MRNNIEYGILSLNLMNYLLFERKEENKVDSVLYSNLFCMRFVPSIFPIAYRDQLEIPKRVPLALIGNCQK